MAFKNADKKRSANIMIVHSNILNVVLSSVSIDDADAIARSANNPDISYNLGGMDSFPFPYTRQNAIALIESAALGYSTNSAYHMAIKNSYTNDILGMVALHDIDIKNRHCELGYWIGSEYRNKGYATSGIILGLYLGFKELSLNKISSKVLGFNSASMHILDKLGFKKEGTLIENYYIKNPNNSETGSFVDQHIYSIFRNNYPKIEARID